MRSNLKPNPAIFRRAAEIVVEQRVGVGPALIMAGVDILDDLYQLQGVHDFWCSQVPEEQEYGIRGDDLNDQQKETARVIALECPLGDLTSNPILYWSVKNFSFLATFILSAARASLYLRVQKRVQFILCLTRFTTCWWAPASTAYLSASDSELPLKSNSAMRSSVGSSGSSWALVILSRTPSKVSGWNMKGVPFTRSRLPVPSDRRLLRHT